jgi:hypothetical protein
MGEGVVTTGGGGVTVVVTVVVMVIIVVMMVMVMTERQRFDSTVFKGASTESSVPCEVDGRHGIMLVVDEDEGTGRKRKSCYFISAE